LGKRPARCRTEESDVHQGSIDDQQRYFAPAYAVHSQLTLNSTNSGLIHCSIGNLNVLPARRAGLLNYRAGELSVV
jgi:hypothetical protein